jgi:hypothetical protein
LSGLESADDNSNLPLIFREAASASVPNSRRIFLCSPLPPSESSALIGVFSAADPASSCEQQQDTWQRQQTGCSQSQQ